MKKLSVLIILVLFFLISNAQISLDSLNFPIHTNATDSLENIGSAKMPKQGANMEWDYSTVSFNGSVSPTRYSAPANNIFKNATRSSTQSFPISMFSPPSQCIKNTHYFTDNSRGYACTGYSVAQRQVFGFRVGGGNSDSLIYQVFDTSIAANPQYILKYPAAYDSVWAYNARLTYPIEVYITPPPSNYYFNGREIIYRSVIDSVVGWGNMIVPYVQDTGATVSYPVIMVKESQVDIDSFWIGGLPGYSSGDVDMLLSNFNLNQGQKSETYSYIFYRAGYSAPLAKFWAISANFDDVDSAGFDPNNTILSGIKTIPAPASVSVYPNPVTGPGFTVTLAGQDNAAKLLTITNSLGKLVQALPLSPGLATINVPLPATLANGMYYYTITETGGARMMNGKFVVAR